MPGIGHRYGPDTPADDAMLSALRRDPIRDSRCRPARARVRTRKTVIAPDAHTPTVPSTTAIQSVTPCNGESRVTDIDRSDGCSIWPTGGISAMDGEKDHQTA